MMNGAGCKARWESLITWWLMKVEKPHNLVAGVGGKANDDRRAVRRGVSQAKLLRNGLGALPPRNVLCLQEMVF